MIEVPAAAMIADVLARLVDFFSIGTNDLVQYTLAVDRVNERVARYYQPVHLAIFRLMRRVVEAGRKFQRSVSLCGEMSGDPKYTLALLGLGIRELSMPPASVPNVKKFVRSCRMQQALEASRKMFDFEDSHEAEAYLERRAHDIVPEFFV